MNSMNKIINEIKSEINIINLEQPDKLQIAIDVFSGMVHSTLAYLKAKGFTQLSLVTCIDWIETNEFQMIYILMDWETGIHMQVRAMLDRNDPSFITVTDIYPGAKYYEREVHEFFGVTFSGNDESFKPLLLELWDDIPPLRKDFDPLEYSERKFPRRLNESKFTPQIGACGEGAVE